MNMATRRPPTQRSARQPSEAKAGFAIGTYAQDHIEVNAREHSDPRHGDPEWHTEMVHLGVMTADGEITDKGWVLLNRDTERLERNSLAWMKATFNSIRDDGNNRYDDLVGSFWFDPTNYDQAWLVELASSSPGRSERIDMTDASYGDLANTAFDGVSAFGGSVLGGAITFFDVKLEDMEIIEQTIEAQRRRRTSEARRHPPVRRRR